ncbi:MAG: hypothetical protein AABX91_02335 [Nanoarchaeota archaeon]
MDKETREQIKRRVRASIATIVEQGDKIMMEMGPIKERRGTRYLSLERGSQYVTAKYKSYTLVSNFRDEVGNKYEIIVRRATNKI